jgi:hypothetical protein
MGSVEGWSTLDLASKLHTKKKKNGRRGGGGRGSSLIGVEQRKTRGKNYLGGEREETSSSGSSL